ncbi:MAG TPA: helix-turn-helix domain-containing protein [Candidatus Bathyarchaeia archaeon]|nr:helix-turn-helix domain-containing protein [Candidatus Bathyarchaeia archaeon]
MIGGLAQEWMLKTLVNFGFERQDAEVYVYLALNGPKKAKDIATALKTYERQIYRSIKNLQDKEIVNATPDLPAIFSVISLDKLLDLLAKASLEEARRIEQEKDGILRLWKSCVKRNS